MNIFIEILGVATLCSEIPVKFILGVFNAWIVNSAFQCNPMCWLITIKCCSDMEFPPTIDCASFWYLCA